MRKHLLAAALAVMFIFGLTGCEQTPQVDSIDPSIEPTAAPSLEIEPSEVPPVELSAEGELLMSFLNGEMEAVVGEDFYNDLAYVCGLGGSALEGIERLSFSELTKAVATSDVDSRGLEISYALMKTLSGREMLAVRYQDFSNPGFSYGCYAIFGVYDRELRLTYAEDYWNRSDTQLHQGLIFSGNGSGGAGVHSFWYGYIDDTGHYRKVYEIETLQGWWAAMYASSVFEGDSDWAANSDCTLYLLTTDEGEFYELYEGQDTDPEKLALLRDYLAGQGITEIDHVEQAIAQAKTAHGMEDTAVFEDWIPWEAEG